MTLPGAMRRSILVPQFREIAMRMLIHMGGVILKKSPPKLRIWSLSRQEQGKGKKGKLPLPFLPDQCPDSGLFHLLQRHSAGASAACHGTPHFFFLWLVVFAGLACRSSYSPWISMLVPLMELTLPTSPLNLIFWSFLRSEEAFMVV